MSAGYLEPSVAREVFGGERDVLAWGMGPGAKAIRVEGGWRITGNWAFASGSRHATWLGAHCPCFEADGTPQRHPDGRPWERTMLFRREIATIKDIWQVVGLRGTGSDAYSVQDLFVDDAHTMTRDRPEERREPGLIYRFAAMQIYASGFAAVALGAARAALDAFIDLARGKTPALTTERAARQRGDPVRHRDRRCEAEVGAHLADPRAARDAGRGEARRRADDRSAHRDPAGRPPLRSTRRRRWSMSPTTRRAATAIFDANPFERRFRDVNTVTQQVQGRRSHFETVGQHLLGARGEPALAVGSPTQATPRGNVRDTYAASRDRRVLASDGGARRVGRDHVGMLCV